MSKFPGWFKGLLLSLLVMATLALALAWLFRSAGQEPGTGQEVLPASTPSLERAAKATTLSLTQVVTPTATPESQETVRILYAVQPPGEAVTLWTLDFDPATDAVGTHELTTSPYESAAYFRVYEVSVSPDRQYIALNSQNVQVPWEYAIWTAQTDGVWLSQLTSLERFQTPVFLDWIPDSERMLARGDYIIVDTIDVRGGDFHTLLSFRADDLTVPDAGIEGAVKGAAISPDGRTVAFSVDPGNEIWLLALDGDRLDVSSIEKFSGPTKGQGGGGAYGLAWSPTGEQVAYFDTLVSEMSQIQVMDIAGAEVSLLSSDDVHNLYPVWSEDGTALVYIRETTPGIIGWDGGDPASWNSSVWVAEVETGRYDELVPSEGKASWSATWLPGGLGVVFVSNRAGQSDVWVVNRDGTGLHPLTDQGNVVALDILPGGPEQGGPR